MTDGTSQGLFIVVAIVIFGIFVVLAYILFEDTLSPALATMFTDAIEKSSNSMVKSEIIYSEVGFKGKDSQLIHFENISGGVINVDKDEPHALVGDEFPLRLDFSENATNSEIRFLLPQDKVNDLEVGDSIVLYIGTRSSNVFGEGNVHLKLGGSLSSIENIHRPTIVEKSEKIVLTIDTVSEGVPYISIKMRDSNLVFWTSQWVVEKQYN